MKQKEKEETERNKRQCVIIIQISVGTFHFNLKLFKKNDVSKTKQKARTVRRKCSKLNGKVTVAFSFP